jgi:hypothetical protein
MSRVIRIPFQLTASCFGCDAEYFRDHLRGKRVTVVSETTHFITVQDDNDEQWTVNKKDLDPNTEEPISSSNQEAQR